MLRRTRPWRTGSALLKRRAPVLWEDLAAGWGRAAAVVGEPLQMARDYPLSLAVGLKHRAAFSDVQCFVMFVGYPRSGHTIVGSLLNAHPNIVMGHRLRVLRYVAARFRREQLLAMVLLSDRRFEKLGRVGSKRYNYSVPGQWQGRHSKIRVIGDSNVVNTFVRRRPELLPQLAAIVGVPTRMIHVVRNPFDNISTMSMRNRLTLSEATERYFWLCDGIEPMRLATAHGDWFDLRHEDLLEDAAGWLRRLCEFVGVPADRSYLEACATIVYRRPHHSRHEVEWSSEMIERVQAKIEEYPFLKGYSYEDAATEPALRDG